MEEMLNEIKNNMLNAEYLFDWCNESLSYKNAIQSVTQLGLTSTTGKSKQKQKFQGRAFSMSLNNTSVFVILRVNGWVNLYAYEGFLKQASVQFKTDKFVEQLQCEFF